MAQPGQSGLCLRRRLSQKTCDLLSHHHLFVDDFLGQINRFQFFLIILFCLLLLTGNIDKSCKDCIFLLYVYNILKGGQMVFRICNTFAMDVLAGVKYPLEIHRINKLIKIHFQSLRPCFSEILFPYIRILQNLHVRTHNQHNIRGGFHHQIGHGLRFFVHIGNTHGNLRLVLKYSNRLLSAGWIAAGTAVKLVLRLKLISHAQDLTDLFLCGHGFPGGPIQKFLFKGNIVRCAFQFKAVCRFPRDSFLHIQLYLKSGNKFVVHCRAFDAAAGTHIHLDKAALYLSSFHTLTQVNAVGFTMNVELAVAVCPFLQGGKHGVHYPVGYGIKAVYLWIKGSKRHILTILNGNFFLFQPFVQISEIQHCIDPAVMARILGLFFLRYTGTEKYCLYLAAQFFL